MTLEILPPQQSAQAQTQTPAPWVSIAARLIARGDSLETVALLCDQPINLVSTLAQTAWFVSLVKQAPIIKSSVKGKLYDNAETILNTVLDIMREGGSDAHVRLKAATFLFEQINGRAVQRSHRIEEKRDVVAMDAAALEAEIIQLINDDPNLKLRLRDVILQ